MDHPSEARQQLVSKIVDRVIVYDDRVAALALHGDYSVVLDTDVQLPSEVSAKLRRMNSSKE